MGLSIGDVEKITGISKDRLRYYEEKRLITPVRDTDNSYREYDNEEVLKLLGIQLYRSMDLGVKEIQQIQDSDTIEEICGVFKNRQKELNFQMAQLQYQQESVSRGIDDCEKIADHLGKYTLKKVRTLRLICNLRPDILAYLEAPFNSAYGWNGKDWVKEPFTPR